MNYRIVPMEARHINGVRRLEELCFVHPWSVQNLTAQLTNENARFLVAEQEENVIGYIGITELFEVCEVQNVAVDPACRRQGIGQALLTAAMEGARSRGRELITLEVRPSNSGALTLYRKNGFVEAGRRREFYSDPTEDGLILTKYFDTVSE